MTKRTPTSSRSSKSARFRPAKAPPAQLRREILQEAVEENVSLRQARRFDHDAGRRAGRSWRWALWAVPAAVVVLLLVLAPSDLLTGEIFAGLSFADPASPDLPVATSPSASASASDFSGTVPSGADDKAPAFDETPAAEATSSAVVSSRGGDDLILQAVPRPIAVDVFSLEVRRVVIDPGHGGDDSGTQAGLLAEKELTLDIAERLEKKLLAHGFDVRLTRRSDQAVSLRERTDLANEWRADLFVSIHINWIADRGVRGLETYYLGATDDPYLEALARRENSASGYSLADLRGLLESIYADARTGESAQLASRVQESLYFALSRENPALKNRGVKTAPFVVLTGTEMPAILAEVSCLSNRDEARLLERPLYREHIAGALSQGIRSYAADVKQIDDLGNRHMSYEMDATR